MPKIKCSCGNVLSYGDIPCEIEFLYISDNDFDKLQEFVDVEKLYMEMKSVLKCPNCNRLWVFSDGYNNQPKEYIEVKNN
ncbi:hypothetical protein VQL36_20475 [Chengkuizengella sp. SCS-71B]|uniref:hypothetical protein n=1 Tax=Chengkuizengella sp. SCS-71B TaxID=3115290 RepID=UPI0032C232D2